MDSLACEFLRMADALVRSRLSKSESVWMLGPLVDSQRSLMLIFLLEWSRCLLVKLIRAALCVNVGIQSPQLLMGELAHSVTQELGGHSSQSLIWQVHSLSTTPDRKASVKLKIFNSKKN